MNSEWLAGGGTYLILGVAWLCGVIGFVVYSLRIGIARGEEADGCALAMGTVVTMSVGGGIGLRLAPYPWFILVSLSLGILCPSLLVAFWHRKRRK